MNNNEMIHAVLSDHPEFDSIEQVQAECAKRGTEVGIWTVYFAAKSEGRKLVRRPLPPDPEDEIRDVALTLLGLHRSADSAIATLRRVEERNRKGDRVPWEIEKTAPTETWELSVAQELLDLCGGSINAAIKSVMLR